MSIRSRRSAASTPGSPGALQSFSIGDTAKAGASAAVVGAIVAGPLGAIIGGALGTTIAAATRIDQAKTSSLAPLATKPTKKTAKSAKSSAKAAAKNKAAPTKKTKSLKPQTSATPRRRKRHA